MTMVQTTWGWLIVIYLFLGGLGAGAFLCSALAYKGFLGSLNERFYKFGFLLAPVAVIIGTALLLFDLAPSAAINPIKILKWFNVKKIKQKIVFIILNSIFICIATI